MVNRSLGYIPEEQYAPFGRRANGQFAGLVDGPISEPTVLRLANKIFDVLRVSSASSVEIHAIQIENEIYFELDEVHEAVPALADVTAEHEHVVLDTTTIRRGNTRRQSPFMSDDGETVTLISELGVIFKCLSVRSVAAREFADWILNEVAPAMRETCEYVAGLDTLPVVSVLATINENRDPDIPHTLYRMFDEDDRLLYVGISMSGIKRLQGHKGDKPWWYEIARVNFEHYPNHRTAREAEREAIASEGPKYNIAS